MGAVADNGSPSCREAVAHVLTGASLLRPDPCGPSGPARHPGADVPASVRALAQPQPQPQSRPHLPIDWKDAKRPIGRQAGADAAKDPRCRAPARISGQMLRARA
nr:hypothetical protein StreXyl84_16290 [Streptomyces sp. Xyl84]